MYEPLFRKKYWIVIILAALAVAAGCVYYILQPAPDPGGPIVTNHQANLAKNWKTYINDKYGFSFMYPPQFEAVECSPAKDFVILGQGCESSKVPLFTFAVDTEHGSDYIVKKYEDILKSGKGFNKTVATVNGQEAVVLTVDEKPQSIGVVYKEYVVISKGGINYVIGSDDKEVLNQILNTFKFTK